MILFTTIKEHIITIIYFISKDIIHDIVLKAIFMINFYTSVFMSIHVNIPLHQFLF